MLALASGTCGETLGRWPIESPPRLTMDLFDVGGKNLARDRRVAVALVASFAATLGSRSAAAAPSLPAADAPGASSVSAPDTPAADANPPLPAPDAPPVSEAPAPAPPLVRPAPPVLSPPPPPAPPRLPTYAASPEGPFHLVVALNFGSCVRDDDNVGSTGFCGEALGGFDSIFAPRWHFDVEVGIGYIPHDANGDTNLGVGEAAGGGYVVLRPMLGYDMTALFLVRAGVQLRSTYTFDKVSPGIQGVVDLGTRVFTHFEVGLRGFVGVDAFATAGIGADDSIRFTAAYGTTLFARYLFP